MPVVHCCPLLSIVSPGSMLSPWLGCRHAMFFKQENIDPEMVCWEFLGLGVISLSNRSLYHSRVCVIPTCNATPGVCWVFVKTHLSGVKHGEIRLQRVNSSLCQFSIVVHCVPRVYVIHIFGLAACFLMFLQDKIDPRPAGMTYRVYV